MDSDELVKNLVTVGIIFTFLVLIGGAGYSDIVLHDYFGGTGICTEKFTNETGCYVVMDKETYGIDSQLYKGVLVGEMYQYNGDFKKILYINKYVHDSGF